MIGLCSVTFREKTVEEIILLAQEVGLKAIEWGSDGHVPETDTERAQEVAELMEKAGLQTSSYGTYYRLGTHEDFENYLEVAKILGASTLRVWAGEKSSAETSVDERQHIIEDAQRIGELAQREGLIIGIEYHARTLTDTRDSAIQLMEEINHSNVLLYWQPAESLSVKERLESLPILGQWITNVHVFHWEHYHNRFPLADGFEDWKKYIGAIEEHSPHEHNYLLEFVPGDDQVQGFVESVETLKEILAAVK